MKAISDCSKYRIFSMAVCAVLHKVCLLVKRGVAEGKVMCMQITLILTPCPTVLIWGNIKSYFQFSTQSFLTLRWKSVEISLYGSQAGPRLSYTDDTMAADALAPSIARTSAAMVSIYFYRNNPVLNQFLTSNCTQVRFCLHVTEPLAIYSQKALCQFVSYEVPYCTHYLHDTFCSLQRPCQDPY